MMEFEEQNLRLQSALGAALDAYRHTFRSRHHSREDAAAEFLDTLDRLGFRIVPTTNETSKQ